MWSHFRNSYICMIPMIIWGQICLRQSVCWRHLWFGFEWLWEFGRLRILVRGNQVGSCVKRHWFCFFTFWFRFWNTVALFFTLSFCLCSTVFGVVIRFKPLLRRRSTFWKFINLLYTNGYYKFVSIKTKYLLLVICNKWPQIDFLSF